MSDPLRDISTIPGLPEQAPGGRRGGSMLQHLALRPMPGR